MHNIKNTSKKYSKNLRNVYSKINVNDFYHLQDAINFLRDNSYAKFDETLEIVMKLGVDPKHSDQMVRGMVKLPCGTGRNVKVAVICKDEVKMQDALNNGADIVGNTEIIDEIKSGNIKYDVYITTPDMMGVIGSVAKILGPKGLMPNPKLGTVTLDIAGAVKSAKSGQVEFRVEKAGIIHAGIGKLSFITDDLLKNAQAFISTVIKAKPVALKGSYLRGIYLTSTMGPSIKINLIDIV